MKLVETNISETTVRMRYADNADATKAKHWLDFQVPISELKTPLDMALGDLESQFLATVRQVALRSARDVIDAEIQRLRCLREQIRG